MLDFLVTATADSALNRWIAETYWLWPVLEIIHFIGLSIMLGALLIIDLRMLGLFRAINAESTHRLLPWVWIGFCLNLITGILFIFGDAGRYAINIGFQLKMLLIFIAGLNAALYHWKVSPIMSQWTETTATPAIARVVAATSLAAWTGVLLLGRLIPYVGTG